MAHYYEIGTTYVGMKNLGSLTVPVPAPKGDFVDYSRRVNLGDSTVRGLGYARGFWRWNDGLERTQRDQLKAFCSGASAAVFIRTRRNDNSDEYKYYTTVMIWPEEEEREWGWRKDFVIEFRNCVVYTP